MTTEDIDHYSVLGVLPEAEPIVITAAYRALAQRYHPDRWAGPPEVAHERMSRINSAYAILSNAETRAAYDKTRDKRAGSDYSTAERDADSFDEALSATADRWALACEIYPDLNALRAKLRRTSSSLALAFTSLLLEEKRFANRAELAQALEHAFLVRYFSTDPKLVDYARRLILIGQREPLRALNRLVDVLGGEEPDALIRHIDAKFSLASVWKALEEDERRKEKIYLLTRRFLISPNFENAHELAQYLGYTVHEVGVGLFQACEVQVFGPQNYGCRHPNKATFVDWVRSELCD